MDKERTDVHLCAPSRQERVVITCQINVITNEKMGCSFSDLVFDRQLAKDLCTQYSSLLCFNPQRFVQKNFSALQIGLCFSDIKC